MCMAPNSMLSRFAVVLLDMNGTFEGSRADLRHWEPARSDPFLGGAERATQQAPEADGAAASMVEFHL